MAAPVTKLGLLGAEEGDDGAEVGGIAEPPGRDRGRGSRRVAAVQLDEAVGGVEAGQHRVHGHAVGGDLASTAS